MKLTREQIDEMLLDCHHAGMPHVTTSYKFKRVGTEALYADEGSYLRLYAERLVGLKQLTGPVTAMTAWKKRRHSKKTHISPFGWCRSLWKTDESEQRRIVDYLDFTATTQ